MSERNHASLKLPNVEEVLAQLERESAALIPRPVLVLLLEAIRRQATQTPSERDGAALEAAINQFEDVLEAFWLKEAIPTS